MWVDTHLHLDAPAFDADREAVIARAAAGGVGLMVSAGTSVESSRHAIGLAERYPNVAAAVGIHPEAAGDATPAALDALAALVRHPRVVAVGEVGLDYHREGVPPRAQIDAFRAQIRLARAADLPVVVHDREAHADVERILEEEGAAKVVLHCFSGTAERAVRCAAAGWMISLAGPVTFANAGALQEVARLIPIDRLLLETDAPYLSPAPLRGRRCEPAFLVHTARAVAALRGMDDGTLAARIVENVRRVFSVGDVMRGTAVGR